MVQVREWIERAGQGVEALAVAIMVCFILIGTLDWLLRSMKRVEGAYERYRVVLGKALLVGLELLVAADIINTVAFALTLRNLALLAGLVVVRTTPGDADTTRLCIRPLCGQRRASAEPAQLEAKYNHHYTESYRVDRNDPNCREHVRYWCGD